MLQALEDVSCGLTSQARYKLGANPFLGCNDGTEAPVNDLEI
jgi:hypothetical protein